MDTSFNLSPEQRAKFARDGVLHLPGFHSPERVAPMADAIWADLKRRFGFDKARRETWTVAWPRQFQAVSKSGVFDALSDARFKAVSDELLGAGRWCEPSKAGPVVSFPERPWALPHRDWHLDYSVACPSAARPDSLVALRIFTLLAPVAPRCGGTVMLAGSWRLATAMAREVGRTIRSSELRERLRSESEWYAALERKDRDPGFAEGGTTIRGVELHFEEICGQAGDVVVMHPNTLHAAASNAGDGPRMMMAQTPFLREALGRQGGEDQL